MISISPQILDASEEVFKLLEEKNLLKRFFNSAGSVDLKEKSYNVKTIYHTNEKFGGHKLICVNYNLSEPQIGFHNEKEDFLLISDNPGKYKNLYLLICMHKLVELENKINNNEITDKDFIIIKLKFNDPNLSFFTMNEKVPHCELVKKNSDKKYPYFYVTEPTKLENISIDLNEYIIKFGNN